MQGHELYWHRSLMLLYFSQMKALDKSGERLLITYFFRWQSQGSYAASEKEDKAKNDNKNGVQSSEPQASYTTTNETHEEATEESADDIMKTGKETAV